MEVLQLLCLVALLGVTNAALTTVFSYPDMCNTNGLSFQGASTKRGQVLDTTANQPFKTGAVWLAEPVLVGGTSWKTSFSFRMKTSAGTIGADGMAFVVQSNSAFELGDDQGQLGYAPIPGGFAVELDTFLNVPFKDPNAHHISLHYPPTPTGRLMPEEVVGRYEACTFAFNDGKIHNMTVEYTSTTKQLTMNLDNGACQKSVPFNLSASVTLLPDNKAYLGFTGATGGAYQTTEIISWSHQLDLGSTNCLSNEYDKNKECAIKPQASDCSVYKSCAQCTELAAACCGFCSGKCESAEQGGAATCSTRFSCPVKKPKNDNHQVVVWGVVIVVLVLVLCAVALFIYWRRTRVRSRTSTDPTLLNDGHQVSDRDAETQYSQL